MYNIYIYLFNMYIIYMYIIKGKENEGLISVTDMDQIEKSNLSRQFLFRNTDINTPKSTTAVIY